MKTNISDNVLRPTTFAEYLGQEKAAKRIQIALKAAKMRGEVLDHILLSGPPGLGKTSLAGIVAAEIGGNLKHYTGPALEKADDLWDILDSIEEGDVLFIDEIHALPPKIEEVLLTLMEDGIAFFPATDGFPASRLEVKPFTLIGATTRSGSISRPLRDRFGIKQQMEYYTEDELTQIVTQAGDKLDMTMDTGAARAIAKRGRDTPRIANALLRRARDYAQVMSSGTLTESVVAEAMEIEEVDDKGLEALDREYMRVMDEVYHEKPVGIKALAATMREDVANLEDVVEPYLLKLGYVARTPKGRWLTDKGREYIRATY